MNDCYLKLFLKQLTNFVFKCYPTLVKRKLIGFQKNFQFKNLTPKSN